MVDVQVVHFIKELKQYRDVLPKQTLRTLKGQALSGNLEGARKGLNRVLKRKGGKCGKSKQTNKTKVKA